MKKYIESSPRSWGCFRNPPGYGHTGRVFPTLVGVFLGRGLSGVHISSLPHARGGVSVRDFPDYKKGVFPTLVGVFPLCFCRHSKTRRLPHARGGVSYTLGASPPELSVFPTLVGCFSCWCGIQTRRGVLCTPVVW